MSANSSVPAPTLEEPGTDPLIPIRSNTHPHPPPHHAHFEVPNTRPSTEEGPAPVVDIEHVPVEDDPREWGDRKKSMVLGMMTLAVLGPLIAPSIYNPVIDEIKVDLRASDVQIGLSLSMYILFQGWMPVIWASVAEIIGRKIVYLTSYAIYTLGSVIASRAQSMPVLIAMRCLQATGSAAVTAVGAGSLADMYEVHERGQKLGLFYGMPLLGPAIGPLIGGALGNAFGWRSPLYFLAVYAGLCEIMFIFFPDTWRKQRSQVYQKAMEDGIKRALHSDLKRQKKLARGLDSRAPTPSVTPGHRTPNGSENVGVDVDVDMDTEAEAGQVQVIKRKRRWFGLGFGLKKSHRDKEVVTDETFKPTLGAVNPLPTMVSIFRRPTNAVIFFCSGVLFGGQYTIVYTASLTLAAAPYHYNPLHVGLVVLAFGVGSVVGSVVGGRYSDRVLRRLKEKNGGVSVPEMRLKSTVPALPLAIGSFLAYGWTADKHVHIAGIVVTLFFGGFSIMIIYSSTLAYLVDSNPGRSASAVSCGSFVRGSFGCVLSQIAQPIQKAVGDGGLYSIYAGLLVLCSGGFFLLIWKGEEWRLRTEDRGARRRQSKIDAETEESTRVESTVEMEEIPGVGAEKSVGVVAVR